MSLPYYPWHQLASLWDRNDFGGVHDWLGARWNQLIQERPQGHDDPDARFLQGLAYAALALHFTQHHNQDGARLMAEDAVRVLSTYQPAYAGVAVVPVIESIRALQPCLAGIDNDADCPMQPLRYAPFQFVEYVS